MSTPTKTVSKPEIQIAVPTKIRVSKSLKLSGQPEISESTEEVIEVHKFATTPAICKVSIPLKMTMDYQSMGIEIGIERPVYVEELDKGMEETYARVFKTIQERLPDIQETLVKITNRK